MIITEWNSDSWKRWGRHLILWPHTGNSQFPCAVLRKVIRMPNSATYRWLKTRECQHLSNALVRKVYSASSCFHAQLASKLSAMLISLFFFGKSNRHYRTWRRDKMLIWIGGQKCCQWYWVSILRNHSRIHFNVISRIFMWPPSHLPSSTPLFSPSLLVRFFR